MITNKRSSGYQGEIRTNLDEVSFVRPILILLVVLYHSMAIHTGNWEMLEGGTIIPAYKAVGRLAYSFMLESFVFVSGYVWAFQRETRGRKESLLMLCQKKAIRLLIPTIVFGLFYFYLLEEGKLTILHLLEGPGHLWFLPMLFECFLISWCLLYFKLSFKIVLPILIIIGIFLPTGLPLRLSLTFYYLPFFLLGYLFNEKYDKLVKALRIGHLLTAWGVFSIIYIGMVGFRSWLIVNVHQPMLLGGGKMFSMMTYSTCGTIALFLTSIYVINRMKTPSWYLKLGSLCMGVYIFQQFVLKILYYHSSIPATVSSWILPFIGFAMGLVVSMLLTYVLRATQIGKKIL